MMIPYQPIQRDAVDYKEVERLLQAARLKLLATPVTPRIKFGSVNPNQVYG
jgi:hypothetical protein